MATVASSVLLDLDLPAGNTGASQVCTHGRHLALCLACSGLGVIYGKNWLAYDKLRVLILRAEMKKTDRALSETAQRLLTDRA